MALGLPAAERALEAEVDATEVVEVVGEEVQRAEAAAQVAKAVEALEAAAQRVPANGGQLGQRQSAPRP